MRAGALPATPTVAPAIRIRHVLTCVILVLGASSALPRARAAFRLYAVATAFADYGLCMVGPTGPSLLRDNPPEFWRLARRRLVAALPDDRPFMKCEKAALVVTDSPASRRTHEAAATAFTEWGGDDATLKLSDLGISTRHLSDLTERAWPFVRGGYTSLVQPSSYAREAAHPVEPPRPVVGHGAPPPRSLTHCVAPDGDAEFVLDLSPDRRSKVVRSVTRQGASAGVPFAPVEARVFSVSCDGEKAIIASGREGSRDVELVACAFDGACGKVPLPRMSESGSVAKFPLDAARMDGVTVVAMTMRGIVRVATTRDDGESWTPPIVVFDPEERSPWNAGEATARLVTNGHRLLVAGSSSSGRSASYWALTSEDAGASWHTP